MLLFLRRYAASSGRDDNLEFVRRVEEGGGLEWLAQIAPGRLEFDTLLPMLKILIACYWFSAIRTAHRRGKLPYGERERLDRFLRGVEPGRLQRLANDVARAAEEITAIGSSALYGPLLGDEKPLRIAADLGRIGERLRRFKDEPEPRLPARFDFATAQESAILLKVEASTGAPCYGATSRLFESLHNIGVPEDLRRFARREFDQKSLADRHYRAQAKGWRGRLNMFTRWLDEISVELLLGRGHCPSCHSESLVLDMILPEVRHGTLGTRVLRCRDNSCGAVVEVDSVLLGRV